jgi:hypothetical protein
MKARARARADDDDVTSGLIMKLHANIQRFITLIFTARLPPMQSAT